MQKKMVDWGTESKQSEPRTYMSKPWASVSCNALWLGWPKCHRHMMIACRKRTLLPKNIWEASTVNFYDVSRNICSLPLQPAESLAISVSHTLLETCSVVSLWYIFSSFTIIRGSKSLIIFLLWIDEKQRKKSKSPKLRKKISQWKSQGWPLQPQNS